MNVVNLEVDPDVALNALMELPAAFRVTVLALCGVPEPMRFEEPKLRKYVDVVTRLAEQGKTKQLIDAIAAIEYQRALFTGETE